MENPSAFRGLHFSAQPSRRPVRAVAVGAVAALFTLLWWVVPHSALYWLLLPAISVLGWMATYGWHQANSRLIHFLQSLDQQ